MIKNESVEREEADNKNFEEENKRQEEDSNEDDSEEENENNDEEQKIRIKFAFDGSLLNSKNLKTLNHTFTVINDRKKAMSVEQLRELKEKHIQFSKAIDQEIAIRDEAPLSKLKQPLIFF